MMRKTLAQVLADYAVNLHYDQLPKASIERAKEVILDASANFINGRFDAAAVPLLQYAKSISEEVKTEATFTFLSEQDYALSTRAAIFAYCAMGRMADMDDGFSKAMGHPGSFLVPTLLIMGKLHKISGKEAIAALVAAYDVYARIAEALNPYMHRERGFDATGVCGSVAAAALLARIMKCDSGQAANAMGLAGTFSGGIIECQQDGTSGKYLCGAWAALNGLRAVDLARAGFTGSPQILEGKRGLFQAFQSSHGFETDHVLDSLGKLFKINEVYFKRFACLRGVHATLDAALQLKESYHLVPEQIEKVEIRASSYLLRFAEPYPKTEISAQSSLPFTTAVVLLYGKLDSAEFLRECLKDETVSRFEERIIVKYDSDLEAYLKEHPSHFSASKVGVYTSSGKILTHTQHIPIGETKETKFGWDMVASKFTHLVEKTPFGVLNQQYIHQIQQLEYCNALSEIFVLK